MAPVGSEDDIRGGRGGGEGEEEEEESEMKRPEQKSLTNVNQNKMLSIMLYEVIWSRA